MSMKKQSFSVERRGTEVTPHGKSSWKLKLMFQNLHARIWSGTFAEKNLFKRKEQAEMDDDLISRSAIKAHYSWLAEDTALTKKDIDDIVDAQPSVDAAPVVRCRDCVHFGECLVTENDYCSKGERKEKD